MASFIDVDGKFISLDHVVKIVPLQASTAEAITALMTMGSEWPGRHDLILTTLDDRVRFAEFGAQEENGRVQVRAGKTDLFGARRLLPDMAGHNIGLVSLLTGTDTDCHEFAMFILRRAHATDFSFHTFISPHPAKVVFDNFFKPFGDDIRWRE
jgi:hypothetical protein